MVACEALPPPHSRTHTQLHHSSFCKLFVVHQTVWVYTTWKKLVWILFFCVSGGTLILLLVDLSSDILWIQLSQLSVIVLKSGLIFMLTQLWPQQPLNEGYIDAPKQAAG